ncbi:hypothetical protein FISHEDRAFT_56032 [Fistulina hepatica ATCC 64428]|uniref:C2H2-type domain-containing protein n=1 Tax=Fistulina hepatica ATCC 64428 TaxID=1128425 RepID=A0A0D7ANC7_9AGAR|nr:hypothetical protein FISHEDRAFT_56032 [Fistulina hepatica ATCC 64428]
MPSDHSLQFPDKLPVDEAMRQWFQNQQQIQAAQGMNNHRLIAALEQRVRDGQRAHIDFNNPQSVTTTIPAAQQRFASHQTLTSGDQSGGAPFPTSSYHTSDNAFAPVSRSPPNARIEEVRTTSRNQTLPPAKGASVPAGSSSNVPASPSHSSSNSSQHSRLSRSSKNDMPARQFSSSSTSQRTTSAGSHPVAQTLDSLSPTRASPQASSVSSSGVSGAFVRAKKANAQSHSHAPSGRIRVPWTSDIQPSFGTVPSAGTRLSSMDTSTPATDIPSTSDVSASSKWHTSSSNASIPPSHPSHSVSQIHGDGTALGRGVPSSITGDHSSTVRTPMSRPYQFQYSRRSDQQQRPPQYAQSLTASAYSSSLLNRDGLSSVQAGQVSVQGSQSGVHPSSGSQPGTGAQAALQTHPSRPSASSLATASPYMQTSQTTSLGQARAGASAPADVSMSQSSAQSTVSASMVLQALGRSVDKENRLKRPWTSIDDVHTRDDAKRRSVTPKPVDAPSANGVATAPSIHTSMSLAVEAPEGAASSAATEVMDDGVPVVAGSPIFGNVDANADVVMMDSTVSMAGPPSEPASLDLVDALPVRRMSSSPPAISRSPPASVSKEEIALRASSSPTAVPPSPSTSVSARTPLFLPVSDDDDPDVTDFSLQRRRSPPSGRILRVPVVEIPRPSRALRERMNRLLGVEIIKPTDGSHLQQKKKSLSVPDVEDIEDNEDHVVIIKTGGLNNVRASSSRRFGPRSVLDVRPGNNYNPNILAEDRVFKKSMFTLIQRACHWEQCSFVGNCGNDDIYDCLWSNCAESFYHSDKLAWHVELDHIQISLLCPFDSNHEDDSIAADAKLFQPNIMEPPAIAVGFVFGNFETPFVAQPSISPERHKQIGPKALHGMVVQDHYLLRIRTHQTAPPEEYDFLKSHRKPPQKFGLLNSPDITTYIHKHEYVLWPEKQSEPHIIMSIPKSSDSTDIILAMESDDNSDEEFIFPENSDGADELEQDSGIVGRDGRKENEVVIISSTDTFTV